MRGRGRGMVRGERWRGGSVKKARMKEEGEAGAEMWIKASPRERESGSGGGGFIRSGH